MRINYATMQMYNNINYLFYFKLCNNYATTMQPLKVAPKKGQESHAAF